MSLPLCELPGCGKAFIQHAVGAPRRFCSDLCAAIARAQEDSSGGGAQAPAHHHPVHQYAVGPCRCGRVRWLYSLVGGPTDRLCGECLRALCAPPVDGQQPAEEQTS